jgi:hypothetical protein
MTFTQGHALLIGVGTYKHHPSMSVPITVRDGQAVAHVLRDPHVCGYPDMQVTVLTDDEATCDGILMALDRLSSLGEDATVFLLYSGHGMSGQSSPPAAGELALLGQALIDDLQAGQGCLCSCCPERAAVVGDIFREV